MLPGPSRVYSRLRNVEVKRSVVDFRGRHSGTADRSLGDAEYHRQATSAAPKIKHLPACHSDCIMQAVPMPNSTIRILIGLANCNHGVQF